MFGLGDNKDEERFWNMVIFKAPLTDDELEDAAPAVIIVLAVLILIGFFWWLLS